MVLFFSPARRSQRQWEMLWILTTLLGLLVSQTFGIVETSHITTAHNSFLDLPKTAFIPSKLELPHSLPGTDEDTATTTSPPPTGAVYEKTLPIPVIGTQTFRLHILSHRRAHLQIQGVLRVDDIVDYDVRPSDGSFSLDLPEGVQKVMRRFRTKLVEFGYDRSTDLPFFVVRPPLPTKIRIHLERSEK